MFRMVTVAPETTAPVGSWIVPVTAVRSEWANATTAKTLKKSGISPKNFRAKCVLIDSLQHGRAGEINRKAPQELRSLPPPLHYCNEIIYLYESLQTFSRSK